MDSYTRVCSICENIKDVYANPGSEDAVINMATAIINEVASRKRKLINNAKLSVQHQLSKGKEEITITREEAVLFDDFLAKKIRET